MSQPLPPESVWDYPRPPRLEPCRRRVRIELAGVMIVDSVRALRILETSHPPTIYIPPADVRMDLVTDSDARPSHCEWKGRARYHDVVIDGRRFPAIAWSYASPNATYAALADHLSFYPGRVDSAWLDDERVQAQAGDFYGGWITSEIRGPFKGAAGTWGW